MCPHAEKERILGIYSYMPIAEICLLLREIRREALLWLNTVYEKII